MIVKLTKRAVDTLAPIAKPFVAYDADLPGFGLRVMPSGVKSFVAEYRPNGGGRGVAKRRVTIGKVGTITAEQARKAAGDLLARARLGADPAQEIADRRAAQTVTALCDGFESEHVDKKLKASSRASYNAALAQLKAAHGTAKAASVTRTQIAALHAKQADSPYAANRALATWSKLFVWGMSRGFVPRGDNPAREIDRYRESKRERFLTADELARLGDALRDGETVGLPYVVDETKPKAKHAAKVKNRLVKLDPFAVAAIRLLILTGARLREILDAEWSQVDLQRGMLFLADSKTGRKPIYLNAGALAVLAELPHIEGNPHIVAGAKDGAPRADLQRPWGAVRRTAGLDGVRLHDLRHSFASVGAGASLGLPIIGKLLGHTQAATTARYAHLESDPLRRAADRIGATIVAAMDRKSGVVEPMKKTRSRGKAV